MADNLFWYCRGLTSDETLPILRTQGLCLDSYRCSIAWTFFADDIISRTKSVSCIQARDQHTSSNQHLPTFCGCLDLRSSWTDRVSIHLCRHYRRHLRSGEIRLLPLDTHFNHSLRTHNQSKEDHYHGVHKRSSFLHPSLRQLRTIPPDARSLLTIIPVRIDAKSLEIIGYFTLSKSVTSSLLESDLTP